MRNTPPATRDEAIDLIRQSRLAERIHELAPLLRPSIRLLLDARVGETEPIGRTRLGGDPDLPAGFAWPTWAATVPRSFGRRSKPLETALAFVAQLRLSDLAPLDAHGELPPEGLLYFFYDTETQPWCLDAAEAAGGRVIFVPDESSRLARTRRPDVGTTRRLRACAVALRTEWTLPSGILYDDDGENDAYDALVTRLHAGDEKHSDTDVQRVLGWTQGVQDPPEECGPDTYTGPPEREHALAEDWRLLLQLDSDEESHGCCFGDLGRVFFMAHAKDVRERHFDRAWYTLQCT